jgi:exodeoxyribonuclease VII small subunit
MTFEQSLERLATVVEALENDGTSLADAMALYEEGITLAQTCRQQLEQAELKITELRARTEGGLAEEEIDI